MSGAYQVLVDQKAIAHARKILDRYRGRPLLERMGRGARASGAMLVKPINAAAPVGKTHRLGRSAKVRPMRARGGISGASLGAKVGPTDWKSHLVIRPHRIVTPGGRDTGRMTSGNPFVDAAVQPRIADIVKTVRGIVFGP